MDKDSDKRKELAERFASLKYSAGWKWERPILISETERAVIVVALRSPPAADGGAERNERHKVVVDWGARCFGIEHMKDKIVRAARFFEEAAELVQAVGLPMDHAFRAFQHVYSRPAGNVEQEAGGVGVTLMALCDALGLSADACEAKEIARCLSKTPESFAARNIAKIEHVDTATPTPSPMVTEEEIKDAIITYWQGSHLPLAKQLVSLAESAARAVLALLSPPTPSNP